MEFIVRKYTAYLFVCVCMWICVCVLGGGRWIRTTMNITFAYYHGCLVT